MPSGWDDLDKLTSGWQPGDLFSSLVGERLRELFDSQGISITLFDHATGLRRRLLEAAPQVVHTHSSKAGILGRLAAAWASL